MNKKINIYTCPMHPEISSKKPGKCPECRMELVIENEQFSQQIRKPKKQAKTRAKKSKLATENKATTETKDTVKEKSQSHKLLFIVTAIFLLSLAWFLWVIWYKVIPHEIPKVHYHAGFIVVEDNKLIDFSKSEYMDIESCTLPTAELETEAETPGQLQMEKAHLHMNVGDVVHMENAQAKWSDLFTNIKYPISYQDTIAYINGRRVSNFQNTRIQPYQSLVLFIGSNNDIQKFLSQAVTKDHIQDIQSRVGGCGGH